MSKIESKCDVVFVAFVQLLSLADVREMTMAAQKLLVKKLLLGMAEW
jgi:hypothetical protein